MSKWRYHHYSSALPFIQKKTILFSTLKKLHHLASDNKQLFLSALHKLREFATLEYPVGLRKMLCVNMLRETGNPTWIKLISHQF